LAVGSRSTGALPGGSSDSWLPMGRQRTFPDFDSSQKALMTSSYGDVVLSQLLRSDADRCRNGRTSPGHDTRSPGRPPTLVRSANQRSVQSLCPPAYHSPFPPQAPRHLLASSHSTGRLATAPQMMHSFESSPDQPHSPPRARSPIILPGQQVSIRQASPAPADIRSVMSVSAWKPVLSTAPMTSRDSLRSPLHKPDLNSTILRLRG